MKTLQKLSTKALFDRERAENISSSSNTIQKMTISRIASPDLTQNGSKHKEYKYYFIKQPPKRWFHVLRFQSSPLLKLNGSFPKIYKAEKPLFFLLFPKVFEQNVVNIKDVERMNLQFILNTSFCIFQRRFLIGRQRLDIFSVMEEVHSPAISQNIMCQKKHSSYINIEAKTIIDICDIGSRMLTYSLYRLLIISKTSWLLLLYHF